MMAGVTGKKKRLGGTTSSVTADAVPPDARRLARAYGPPASALAPGEGSEGRKVFDVWYTPKIEDVYAQLKVAETMLSRIPDIELTPVRRKMFELEDLMWQFASVKEARRG